MPVGREHLVAAEDVEVGIQRLDVHGHMGHGLGPVDEREGAVPMGGRDHGMRGRDGAQRVGDGRDGDEPGPAAQQPLVLLQDHLAAVVHGRDPQAGTGLGDELLPGHDVGVVLQVRDDDLVARADVLAAPALGDEVDALGGAAHEDDLALPTAR